MSIQHARFKAESKNKDEAQSANRHAHLAAHLTGVGACITKSANAELSCRSTLSVICSGLRALAKAMGWQLAAWWMAVRRGFLSRRKISSASWTAGGPGSHVL